MFIAAVHVFVKPDRVAEFEALIKANHEGSIREPGCLRFDVARSNDDATEYLLWECYVDEAANQAHKLTPHYLAFREQLPALQRKDRYSDRYTGVFVPVARPDDRS